MSRHIDRFERICGQMAHNNPDKPPTDEKKIDWFLKSVTEKTYDSVHATCTDKLLDGDLTFAKVIKLYTHRCFQCYPHFQLDDLERGPSKTVSNNSTTYTDGKRDNGKGKGSGRGRFSQTNVGGRGRTRTPSSSSRSRTPSKGKGKGKGKSSHRRDKGKSSYRSTSGDRTPYDGTQTKPKETCGYCGGNHIARNCWKRQNEEKKDGVVKFSTPPHKQANLNLQIEEASMMFSQSVVSVVPSDTPISPTFLTQWGENDNENDNENNNEGTLSNETLERQPTPEAQQATEQEEKQSPQELENTQKETKNLPVGLELGLPKTKESPPTSDSALVMRTSASTSAEDKGLTTIPSLEREAYGNHPSLTGGSLEDPLSLMRDPPPGLRIPVDESSSVEPEWGQVRKQSERELQQSFKEWEEVNVNRKDETYRVGRCHMCDITMYTRNPKANAKLTCFACQEDMKSESQAVADCERQDWRATSARFPQPKGKHGSERRDRDDEEEQRRIPIPLSDDSDTWLDEFLDDEAESEREEETSPGSGLTFKQAFLTVEEKETSKKTRHIDVRYHVAREEDMNENKKGTQFWSPNPTSLAFLIGPRLDGIVRMKSGQILHVTEPIIFQHLPKENNQPDEINLKEIPEDEMGPPRWTRHIFTHQRQNLKMQYKRQTKLRRKLMRQIRKGLILRHIETNPNSNLRNFSKSRKRQTKKLQLLLPSPEEYIPLPRTWEEFQAAQELYREHPMWDLYSPQEHYNWTEGWTWDPISGHQPTDDMKKREWENQDTYKQIDLEDAYLLSPLPERLTLTQCVNMFDSPPRTTPPVKRRRTLKVRLQTHVNNRLRPRTSRQYPKPPTQTIPGTPNIEPEQESTQMTKRETKPEHTTEQVEDVELYYRVFNMFRPEQGESNAESAERTLQINKEYALRLK
jgi:hypothetical protein